MEQFNTQKTKLICLLEISAILLLSCHYHDVSVQASESRHQAFIQTDKQLTYIIGDSFGDSSKLFEIKPGSGFSDDDFKNERPSSNDVRLDPAWLEFADQPVGMPRMEKVVVQNNDLKRSLHLLSISGSTAHFHCSFFQDKVVPPGANTSFDVVFLARQVGKVENTLYIHTSIGTLRYQVFGVGIPNPYRLRPYLGARVPINSSFAPMIQMHNPYSTRLQVLEMFASEGDLHLELPTGDKEALRELWELQPFETKAVMKANFVARVENHHSAFIRIKTNKETDLPGLPEMLILPVEIEVSSDPGIYSPLELLDFGILRTLDEPKTLRLNLMNTGQKAVYITSVSVSPPNDALKIDFRPFKLPPSGSRASTVAHITFTAVKALNSKQWAGRIVIKTKNNIQRLAIPYQANVLHGSLAYNVNSTYFFSAKALWNVTRALIFTNTFNFSVVVHNVSFPADMSPYFTVLNFSQPVTIAPQQSMAAFLVQFHPNQTQLHFNTVLSVGTNASDFSIPIIVYNGLMKVIHHRPEKFEGQLDFGTLGVGECRSMIFTIRNDNPVDIVVAQFETNKTWASVEILGMEKGNGTMLTRKHNQSEINIDPLYIKPYHYAVFNVSIVAPEVKGAYVSEIWMFTQFQDLFIPITLWAAEGSLHAIPEKFIFDKVYPGHAPHKVLQIRSTFDEFMEVTQVTFQPPDFRFHFVPQSSKMILQPHQLSSVGKVFFDVKKECQDDCYVGLSTLTPAGHQWLLGMSLDKDVTDTDQYLYTKYHQKWTKLVEMQQNIANVTIELDTTQVRGFLFSAQAHLQWPLLIRKGKIKYPLTQIGNVSVSDFIVENSGDDPVLVQALPLSLYPSPHTILDLLSQRLRTDMTDYVESEENSFFLFDTQAPESKGTSTGTNTLQYRKLVEQSLGVTPHRETVVALLQPGMKLKVKVGFQPKDELLRSSLIVIRNNLTIIDAVVIQGQGRLGEMRFNNKKPGSSSALTFEMTEKHLKNCDLSERKSNKNIVPNFTVRRPFTLRNSGELPFYIHGFSINNLPCEGYGFKVLDCSGFEMAPNSSKKINIAFTPDFTMSQIQRMLTIHTSLSPPASRANFSLQAMVPYDMLSQCSAALPRPTWEPLLYYFVICFMAFVILCILVLAYFESDRVMADYICKKIKVSNSTQTFDKAKIFDLRNVSGLNVATSSGIVSSNISDIQSGKNSFSNQANVLSFCNNNSRLLTNGYVEIDKNLQHEYTGNSSNVGTLSSASVLTERTNKSAINDKSKNRRFGIVDLMLKVVKTVSLYNYFTSEKKNSSSSGSRQLGKPGSSSISPVQKPTATVTALRKEPESTTSENDANILPEKSQFANQQNYMNRGRKGRLNNRRQIVVDASGDTNKKNSKESKDSVSADVGNSSKRSSVGMLEDFNYIPMYNGADDLDDVSGSKNGSQLMKRNKYKNLPESSSKDSHLIRRDSSLADENDDVSSTTTESSGGDSEEKATLGGDMTSDVTVGQEAMPSGAGGKKWKKGSGKHNERMVVASYGADCVDDESSFEVTSKSKAHRKIRVDKETFGGNIMIPSTIELPYCLPKEKEKGDHENGKRSRKSKKTAQKNKGPFHHAYPIAKDSGSAEAWEGCSSERESPPPAWDVEPTQVDLFLPPGDLSELSLQTETFAQKHVASARSLPPPASAGFSSGLSSADQIEPGPRRGSNAMNSVLPAHPSSSGTKGQSPSSYSNIVSSTSSSSSSSAIGAGNRGSNNNSLILGGVEVPARWSSARSPISSPSFQPDQTGLDRSAANPNAGSYAPFSDTPLQNIMPAGVSHRFQDTSAWNTGLFAERDLGCNFGAQPTGLLPGCEPLANPPVDTYFPAHNADLRELYGGAQHPGMLPDRVNQPHLTMMQQLQVERRRRFYEHQQKVNKGEDWPGFSTPPLRHDSLWDPDYSPMECNTWSNHRSNASGGTGFWNTLTNSASSGWSSIQSLANIWGSNGGAMSSNIDGVASPNNEPQVSARPGQQSNILQVSGGAPPFNPFTSMADIWSPTTLSSDSSSLSDERDSSSRWSRMSSGSIHGPVNPPGSEEK
ncbi:transmembrane protein 131-like isoform x2 [Plakobranchus ocellatus]|uniref:Transmembrane protein 131-like isoform x2 n=1 Tax=Plakobranchus ocellatus TaxID=259542 RepID=A0AAV3YEN6_9GAST|nr:transmembrane protein 131-like isoform x2 [Plakobranchus ocellatus]